MSPLALPSPVSCPSRNTTLSLSPHLSVCPIHCSALLSTRLGDFYRQSINSKAVLALTIVSSKWEDKTTLTEATGNAIKPSWAKLCSSWFCLSSCRLYLVDVRLSIQTDISSSAFIYRLYNNHTSRSPVGLNLILLTCKIWWALNNASRWQTVHSVLQV